MALARHTYIEIGNGIYKMVGNPTITTWNTKNRPKNAKVGTLGFNTQTNTLEYWSGADWFGAKLG